MIELDPTGINDGTANAAPAINALLSGSDRDIYIPRGAYRCDDDLRLYEKTRLRLHPDAVIQHNGPWYALMMNGERGNGSFSSGYSGPGDIHIDGGAFDCTPRRSSVGQCQVLAMAHAENILIENTKFLHNHQDHFIEFNSCRHVTVRNTLFEDTTTSTPGSRECINIDYSYSGGFPHFGSYDGTICDDILIEHCTFKDGDVAVGSHKAPSAKHKKIVMRDCIIDGMTSYGVDPRYWDDLSRVDTTRMSGVPAFSEFNGSCLRGDGRVLLRLDDNEAWGLKFPDAIAANNPQGLVLVSTWSNASVSSRGMIWAHCATTEACVLLGGTGFNLRTGPLSGTTGPDGKISISAANDGVLYVENRKGSAIYMELRFMRG